MTRNCQAASACKPTRSNRAKLASVAPWVREYEALVAEFTGYRSGDPLMRLARLVHAWRRFRLVDPTLPAELLPAGWSGIRAARLFHRQHERWRPAAMAEWRRLCR